VGTTRSPVHRMGALFGVVALVAHVECGIPVDLGGTAPGEEAGASDAGCPSLAAPGTKAPCEGCTAGSKGCQANGCFNGYLCDIVGEPDCKAPGTPCSDTTKFDAH
jgi:hypothetical protein